MKTEEEIKLSSPEKSREGGKLSARGWPQPPPRERNGTFWENQSRNPEAAEAEESLLLSWVYLEHSEAGLGESVEVTPRVNGVRELPAKYLHAQQRKDEDEKEENDEEGVDRRDGVHQGLDKVAHRGPVPFL